jgi:hypothetical protein
VTDAHGAGGRLKFHRAAWRSLSAGGFAVTVADPRRVRDLAKGLGVAAKTDAVDDHVRVFRYCKSFAFAFRWLPTGLGKRGTT